MRLLVDHVLWRAFVDVCMRLELEQQIQNIHQEKHLGKSVTTSWQQF